MLIEQALVARLVRVGGEVKALNAKIYPGFLPDTTALPAIVYERKPGNKEDRIITGELDHTQATWKFHCYASQEASLTALTLAHAVRIDLDRYVGAIDSTLTIHYCFLNDQYDNYDGTTKRQRTTVEVDVWYSEKP